MIVYESDVKGFRQDVLTNRIEERIHDLFRARYLRKTSESEVRSWKNSLGYMDRVLAHESVPTDAGVAIEFLIPGTANRIDFVLTGFSTEKRKIAVIIELKQWQEAQLTSKDARVETVIGRGIRETNHPSYQAWSYATLLQDFNEAVRSAPIDLRPCAYLHNCDSDKVIRHQFYESYTSKAPAFLRDDAERLRSFITENVRVGDKRSILYEILNGTIRPSKNLADSLVSLLQGNSEFTLIDEQKGVFETAIDLAKKAQRGAKQVLIVEGGPGTGKSVVAVNLLVRLTQGRLTAKYITKNSAPRAVYEARLTGTLKKTRISNLFGSPDSFVNAEADSFGALIVDEAHRLKEKAGLYGNLGENLIKHLIEAARLTVFFVDDAQRVTLKDIGGVQEIEKWAKKLGAKTTRMELASQFRCAGSDGYLGWIDHALGIRDTANTTLEGVSYDFRVCSSANELRDLIRVANRTNNKARMVAGYCWAWKSRADRNSMDIELPGEKFGAQWNLKQDGGTWLIRPDSVEQVGCIHTCQGLELDYIGVLFGHDLVIRNGRWVEYPDRRAKEDASMRGYGKLLLTDHASGEKRIREVIRNTYRTLMTRGSRGCYVYSVDPETNQFLLTAMGRDAITSLATTAVLDEGSEASVLPFRILAPDETAAASNRVRYFPNIEAAAGAFSPNQSAEDPVWVEIADTYRAKSGMFVVKVVGESMNRRIPNGSWCLFQHNPVGSRNEKIVLVQHHSIRDSDNGGQYTVKRYRSTKRKRADGWAHTSITLWPDSHDRTFVPININVAEETEFSVVGEFIAVL
jgi:DUF2075 family protein